MINQIHPSLSITVDTCPLCRRAEHKIFDELPYYDGYIYYWICLFCGLVYQSPQMDEESQRKFYADKYRVFQFGQAEPPKNDLVIQEKRANHLAGLIGEHCGDLANRLHLDVGSGDGALVRKVQEVCFTSSYGIEPDNIYRQHAVEHGLVVYPSLSDWISTNKPRVYLITMSHVLEHLSNPVDYLTSIRESVLDSSGYLLVEVPNLFFHEAFELAHNFAFSTHTLSEVLYKAGFHLTFCKRHGFPKKKTPRYLTVIARPNNPAFNYEVKRGPFGNFIKRRVGINISRIEDQANRMAGKLPKLPRWMKLLNK